MLNILFFILEFMRDLITPKKIIEFIKKYERILLWVIISSLIIYVLDREGIINVFSEKTSNIAITGLPEDCAEILEKECPDCPNTKTNITINTQ